MAGTDTATGGGPGAPRGSVGQGDYVVRQGDCLHSIARDHGLFWETLWNLPENAELHRVRRDPSVLLPGDRLTIPDLRSKQEEGATETRHRFRRRGVPARLRLELREPEPPAEQGASGAAAGGGGQQTSGQSSADSATGAASDQGTQRSEPARQRPRAGIAYVVNIDGHLTEGTTDDQGRIEITIPPNARSGRLILEPGTNRQQVIPLDLGHMDPVSETTGVRKRLRNLGYPCAEAGTEVTADLSCALSQFQEANDLEVTGEPDQATQDKLVELHGS